MTHLIKLDLQWNELEGEIPVSLEDMTMLQHLDLSSNQMSGEIPEGMGDLFSLKKLFLNDNQLEGLIPEYLCDLNLDWESGSNVNLSNNNLCPIYPECVEFIILNLLFIIFEPSYTNKGMTPKDCQEIHFAMI